MKVVIKHSSDFYGNLLELYPCLKKYKDEYIDDDPYQNYDYYLMDCIVTDMSESEFWDLTKELMKYQPVIIRYADSYDRDKYRIVMTLEIYDGYRE